MCFYKELQSVCWKFCHGYFPRKDYIHEHMYYHQIYTSDQQNVSYRAGPTLYTVNISPTCIKYYPTLIFITLTLKTATTARPLDFKLGVNFP